MRIKRAWMLLLVMSCFPLRAGEYIPPPTILINTPTVATLERGSYLTSLRLMTNGGLLPGIEIGITPRISLGLSYGGTHLIGNEDPKFYPQPGVSFKYHLIDEQIWIPGLSLGFNSQGYGEYEDKHYAIPSPGFYTVMSKNWLFIGNTSIHIGANYSLEQPSDTKLPSVFAGFAFELNPQFSMMLEYDAALNWEASDSSAFHTDGVGFLNAGVRIGLSQNVYVEIDFSNLVWDDREVESFNRELKLIFYNSF